jgi:hypothetical protein
MYALEVHIRSICDVAGWRLPLRLSELNPYVGNFSDFTVVRMSLKLPAGVLACAHKVLLNKRSVRAACCNIASAGLIAAVCVFL